MRRKRGLISAVVAAAALLLGGCAGGEVSAADVQQSVRDGLATQGIEVQSVTCPTGVEATVGTVAVCTVELVDEDAFGQPVDRVRVVVTEVSGDELRYRLEPLAVGVPDDHGLTDDHTTTE
ncbi:DUF4333 domain-containing protein [Ornithinimicrobium sp. F0845]|uniref:DUF4333 domain-containing protein n=1 Tax=Ornithinimicrobium sp. F0845 TaxID=2926412 RepID=UPI001FF396CB|nr:DUF4333 domain-containing protein [Ornithinimicrobium sp. F0845]